MTPDDPMNVPAEAANEPGASDVGLGAAAAPARRPPDEDLSAAIVAAIPKRPGDRVTCRRIYGDYYRCNWWSPADRAGYDNPGMAGLLVTTHTVRKSRFLRVTRSGLGLALGNSAATGGAVVAAAPVDDQPHEEISE